MGGYFGGPSGEVSSCRFSTLPASHTTPFLRREGTLDPRATRRMTESPHTPSGRRRILAGRATQRCSDGRWMFPIPSVPTSGDGCKWLRRAKHVFPFSAHVVKRCVHERLGFTRLTRAANPRTRVGYGCVAYLSVIVVDDAVIAGKLRRT